MTSVLLGAALALLFSLFGTPAAIRFFRNRDLGQEIREDGPEAHFVKKGTPTMGGVVIIGAAVMAYLLAHGRLAVQCPDTSAFECYLRSFTPSGMVAVGVIVAMGILGLIDDAVKIRRRRSLGLGKVSKLIGQLAVAAGFTAAAGFTQAQTDVSFLRPLGVDLGAVFIVWVFIILASSSNGVNLADGLDGLACGSGAMVMSAYVVVSFWQFRHPCDPSAAAPGCYVAPHSFDLAIVAAAMLGAAAGFLWWNAAPAKIFMGDTGSLALGGAMGVLALLTNTQLLLIVLGGLYVIEITSVVLQVVAYRTFGRRLFLMAPVHHHFELSGWPEFTVIVRFWIVAGMAIAFGLGLFYAEFIARGGVG